MNYFNNLSIAKKIGFSIAVFSFPIFLLVYFLIIEKEDLIHFAKKEVAGVHYLRAAHQALAVATMPQLAKPEDFLKAANELQAAEAEDAGMLEVTAKSNMAIESLKKSANSSPEKDLTSKITDLISAISDNSNITLDPDADTYFVGDIIVNQGTAIMVQTQNMLQTSGELEKVANDENKIAFAGAKSGMLTSAGNVANELAKAVKGNASGTVEANLAREAGKSPNLLKKLLQKRKMQSH